MGELDDLVRKYSIKPEKKIKNICAPLNDLLGIPHFGYFVVEPDGRFCNMSNSISEIEYLYANNFHHSNPYFRDPKLFHSGYQIVPFCGDSNLQEKVKGHCQYDHVLRIVRKSEDKLEVFAFLKKGFASKDCIEFFDKIELLSKFTKYFAKEAKDIIGACLSEGYNLKTILGDKFHETDPTIPFLAKAPKAQAFMKKISPLTMREEQCLECFKQGRSAQSTAAFLGISQRTVEHHFETIKEKLGCYSKWELLNW